MAEIIPESKLQQVDNNRIPGERPCGSGSLSWSQNNYPEIPGIHWAVLRTYCNSGREIVIWTDFESGFFGGSERANLNGRKVIDGNSFQSTDANGGTTITGMIKASATITYEFEMVGDRDGTGLINDTAYDLENGDLFLIATDGSALEVEQISYNLANISSEDIKLLAIRYPEITSFFEDFHK